MPIDPREPPPIVCGTRLCAPLVAALDDAIEAGQIPGCVNRSQALERAVRRLLGWPDEGLHPDYIPGPNGHTSHCRCRHCPGYVPRRTRRRKASPPPAAE